MKVRIIALICAAMFIAACGGGGQSSSTCGKQAASGCASQKSCSQTCGMAATCGGQKACASKVQKIISAQVFIKPDKVDAFLAATQSLIEKSRAEEGCIIYTLYQDPQDKTRFMFFEVWKNQAAVDYHFSTEHFKQFGATLDEMASAPPIITIYDSVGSETV